MNWLRHELRLRAHKVGRAIHSMTRSVKSWSEARNHDASLRASIHDGNAVKSFKKRGLTMKENFLVDLSKQFAVEIVNLCTDIKENRKSNVLLNQILRSGTSIGANIHEANYAASKADFINKFQIALKECYETDYWLGLFKDTHMITEEEYKDMFAKCSKIRKLLIASITTAKEND
jgi:four helix bundle protein